MHIMHVYTVQARFSTREHITCIYLLISCNYGTCKYTVVTMSERQHCTVKIGIYMYVSCIVRQNRCVAGNETAYIGAYETLYKLRK